MADDVRFGIGMDIEVTSVDEAKKKIADLRQEMGKVGDGIKLDVKEGDIEKAKQQIKALEKSIKEAEASGGDFSAIFSKNLKDVQAESKKAANEINKTTQSTQKLKQAASGESSAFNSISKTAKLATKEIQGTSSQLDSLKNNLQQGIGQTLAFGMITGISSAVMDALDKTKQLDEISTDISIVSGKTAREMETYRDAAGEAADILGTMSTNYLKASLIYEQQGGDAAYYAKELAESTVVASNISNVATDQMSEYLTATINGFQLLKEKGGEAGTYITDVMSKLGAASGSDLAEIATGLTRTANTAKDVGFEFEEISTMIATVSEVTRRTPETIGNAFKSMLTTFTQLREAGDEEVNAFTNKVEEAFKMGGIEDISVFDNGELRQASDIFKDIADRWETMSIEGQSLVSEAVAGKYQAETFRAFMNNQERYNDLLGQAYDSAGTAAQQQLVYMDSLKAKTAQFGNAWEMATQSIIDSDVYKSLIDEGTKFLKIVASQENAFLSLGTAIAPLVGTIGQIFAPRFVGDAVQNAGLNKLAKMSSEQVKQLSASKQVTAELERQVELGNKQQKIFNILGDSAGDIYKGLREEAESLNEELKQIQATADKTKLDKLSSQYAKDYGEKGYVPGISSDDIKQNDLQKQLAIEEKISKVYSDKIIKTEQLKTLQAEQSKQLSLATVTNKGIKDELTSWELRNEKILQGNESYKRLAPQIQQLIQLNTKDTEFMSLKEKVVSRVKQIQEQINKENLQQINSSEKIVANAKEELVLKERQSFIEQRMLQNQRSEDLVKGELSLNQERQKGIEGVANRTDKATKAVRGATMAYGAIVPIIASYNSMMEGSITKQEMVTTGIQSVGTTLMASMNPWAMAAGLALNVFSMVAKEMDWFKSSAEKAKEKNDELIKSFLSLQEVANRNVDSIRSLKESYERFQGVDANMFLNNPDNSTEDIDAYIDLSKRIAEVRPDLVKYYDDQGRAIVDLTGNYDELLKREQEQVDSTYAVLANNSNSFLVEYTESVTKSRKEQYDINKKLASAEEELNKAQKKGSSKDITEAIGKVADARTELVDVTKRFSDVRENIQANIVNPFTQANTALRELNDRSPQAANAIKEMTSQYVNAGNLESLIGEGDTKAANNLLKNMEKITSEYARLEKENPEAANKFLDKFKETSEYAKGQTLSKEFKDIAALQDSLTKNSTGALGIADSLFKDSDMINKERESTLKLNDALQEQAKLKREAAAKTNMGRDYSNGNDPAMQEVSKQNRAMRELEETIDSGNATYSKHAKKMLELSDAYTEVAKTSKGLNEAQKELQNIGEASKSLEQLKSALQDTSLNISNIDMNDNFNKLKDTMPNVASSIKSAMSDGASSIDAVNDAFARLQETQEAMNRGLMKDNAEYFNEWKNLNSDKITEIQTTFGIQMDSVTTMAELEAQLRSLDAQAFYDYQQGKLDTDTKVTNEVIKNQGTQTAAIKWGLAENEENFLTFGDKFTIATMGWGETIVKFVEKVIGTVADMFKWIGDKWNDFMSWLSKDDGKSDKKKPDYNNVDWSDWDNTNTDAYAREKNAKRQQDKINKEQQEYYKKFGAKDVAIDELLSGGPSDISKYIKDMQNKSTAAAKNSATAKKDASPTKDDSGSKTEIKDLELTLDRYYKLNDILSQIQNQYDSLGKKKSAAYGQDRLNIMQQEQDLLAKQSATLQEYVRALQGEQAELRNSLGAKGFGFDPNGDISNLNEKLKAMQDAANQLSGDAKQAAIDNVKKIQEEASRYQEVTFNLIPNKQKAIEEAKQTFSQIAREKVEYTVKLRLDKIDFKNSLLDVIKEMQDTFDKLDEKSRIIGKQMTSALDDVNYYQNLIKQVKNNSSLTDSDREDLLQQYNKSLLEAVSKSRSSYKELLATQKEFVEQSIDAINKITERYDNIIDKSQTMIDKTKELYRTNGMGQLNKIYEAQSKAIEANLAHLQKSQKELINYRNSLEKGTEAWEAANDAVNELGKNIEENLLKKLEMLKAKFKDFTDNLFATFEKMYGVWGFQGAIDDFDKLIDQQEKYMSGYEKMTTIGSKIKQINEEIANTNDPARAAELIKLRDKEFASLMAQDKVSKDEYERALKLYDIKQKELALSERQNASRIAQLVRDENGNMSYEYVRQESEDLKDEMKDLEDAKNDLYEFDSQKVRESSRKIFEIIQGYQNKLKDLEDKGLSPEEYKKELEKLLAETQAEIDAQKLEVNKWLENAGKDGFNNVKDMFNSGTITADQLGIDKNTLDSIFKALEDGSLTIQDILSGDIGDFADSIGMSKDQVSGAMNELVELILGDNYKIVQGMMDASNKWTSTAQDNVTQLGQAYADYMTQATNTLNQYNKATGDLNTLLNQTNQASKQVIDTINKQNQAMQQAKRDTDNASNSVKNLENRLIGANGSSGLYGSMVQLKKEMNERLQPSMVKTGAVTDVLSVKTRNSGNQYDFMGNKARFAYEKTVAFTDKSTNAAIGQFDVISKKTNSVAREYRNVGNNADTARKKTIDLIDVLNRVPNYGNSSARSTSGGGTATFASGGYTGTWENSSNNAQGKMAVLHEKELILNKQDTSNLIEAVNMQRQLYSNFSGQTKNNENVVNNMSKNINTMHTNNDNSKKVQQDVSIYPSFPNVTNSTEIENAFTNLFGQAAIFVDKTN